MFTFIQKHSEDLYVFQKQDLLMQNQIMVWFCMCYYVVGKWLLMSCSVVAREYCREWLDGCLQVLEKEPNCFLWPAVSSKSINLLDTMSIVQPVNGMLNSTYF